MTIPEIRAICRTVWGATNSNRIHSAMDMAISYLLPDVPVRTMNWLIAMLFDLSAYADQYGDPDVADRLDKAGGALRDHFIACTEE